MGHLSRKGSKLRQNVPDEIRVCCNCGADLRAPEVETLLRSTPFRRGWALSLPHVMATLALCGRANPTTWICRAISARGQLRASAFSSASQPSPSLLVALTFLPFSFCLFFYMVAALGQSEQHRLGIPEAAAPYFFLSLPQYTAMNAAELRRWLCKVQQILGTFICFLSRSRFFFDLAIFFLSGVVSRLTT